MNHDKFAIELDEAEKLLNKDGIKPVVKLFTQRFGKTDGPENIQKLVALLLYCGLNDEDDAFKQFMNLFTNKINDEEHRFDTNMMMMFTSFLSEWSELLKSLFFTDVAECKRVSSSSGTAACASDDDALEQFSISKRIREIRNYKNALSCTALYLQKRNIFRGDTTNSLLDNVKQMLIFRVYMPPILLSQSEPEDQSGLIPFARSAFENNALLQFNTANAYKDLPNVTIMVNACSQPPSDTFSSGILKLRGSSLFSASQQEQRKLKIKDANIHRLLGGEISRQKQIISTQKKLISNALVDAKNERDDALEILKNPTKSNLENAETPTKAAEAAATRAQQSFEKVKEAAATIIASCKELHKDDVEVITESRTAKTTIEADAAIEASLQANQTCEQKAHDDVALIEGMVSEAQSYATTARAAVNAANQLVPVVPTKTAAQRKFEKEQAAAAAAEQKQQAAAAALAGAEQKQQAAAAAAEQKRIDAAALIRKQEEAIAAAAEQKQKRIHDAALIKKQKNANASAKATIDDLLTRVDARVDAHVVEKEAAYSLYGKAGKEAAAAAAAAQQKRLEDEERAEMARTIAEGITAAKQKRLESEEWLDKAREELPARAAAASADAASLVGINMDDFKQLFNRSFEEMYTFAEKIKVVADEFILSLFQSNPHLTKYMLFDEIFTRTFLVIGILNEFLHKKYKIFFTGKTGLQLTAVNNDMKIDFLNSKYPPLPPVDESTALGVDFSKKCSDIDLSLVTPVPATSSLKKTFIGTILLFFYKSGIFQYVDSLDPRIPDEQFAMFLKNRNSFLTVRSLGSPNTISVKKSLGSGVRGLLSFLDVKFLTETENRSIFPILKSVLCKVDIGDFLTVREIMDLPMLTFRLPDSESSLNECVQITIKELTKLFTSKRNESYFFTITTLLKFFSRAVQLSYMLASEQRSTRSIFYTVVGHQYKGKGGVPPNMKIVIEAILNLFLVDEYRLNPQTFHDFEMYKATPKSAWEARMGMSLHQQILGILIKHFGFIPPLQEYIGGKKNKLKTKRKARKTRKTNKSKQNNKKKKFTRNISLYKLTNKSRGRITRKC